ncbi:S8 family serine peptidase, partial [Microcoleus sp. AR_TQ3_B6]|uniref:S8 family serine peptidase n=1 Tax=Microcoleus sp. AR_TQ3_B6 TaxID=3055284 RepID=UPI002FCEDBA3
MTNQFRLPDDLKNTLATDQWWLFNTGQGVTKNTQSPGTRGIDINVLPLWPQYTGKDITVGVIDDGVDGNHKDFAGNFNENLSLSKELGGPFPKELDDNHGTAVAGVIAGRRNNLGTVGVAYEATIAGYKYSDKNNSALESLKAQDKFDVSNNSWGSSYSLNFSNSEELTAIENAVTEGRGGLGTVFAWAGGNERENVNPQLPAEQQRGRNVNSGDYESSRYVIAVAAIDNKGVVAPYSNPGAPLLVSAFGDRPASIATVDRTGNQGYNPKYTPNFKDTNYTNEFNGTSSATPMVSGVVALMLQANPKLGYRDVQEILAYSARKNDPDNQAVKSSEYKSGTIPKDTWTFNGAKNWNGGGLHVNHDYGFGLVDATAAVRLAETWQPRSGTGKNAAATAANEISREESITGLTLPANLGFDASSANIAGTFKIDKDINIDKLELDLNIEHGQFQDLVVKLTSPDKTESVILDRVPYYTEVGDANKDYGFKGTTINYTFSSSRHWGETGLGDWTLNISDNSATNDPKNTDENNTSENNTGVLKGATLRLYGDDIINDNTYIYTNEFASFTHAADPKEDPKEALRKTLTDTNGGNDIINVAAITDDVIVNLTPGSTSTLPGRNVTGHQKLTPQTLTIAAGSIIENAFAGDGNDSIVGNDAANTLWGGRGNDTLVAVGTGDTLIGGDTLDTVGTGDTLYGGRDSLVGGTGNTTYILNAEKADGSTIKAPGGAENNLILNGVTLTTTLAANQNGIDKKGDNLLIDLNADGKVNSRDDLTIENFFLPGSGSFKNVGNLLGSEILSVFAPTPTPTTPTPTTPTPTTPTPTTPTPTTPTPTTPTPTTPTPTTPTPTTPGITLGTPQADSIEGSAGNDTIEALAGEDEAFGKEGNDSLLGNAGDDYLDGGLGNDSLFGGAGNDFLEDEFGNNLLSGSDGDDEVLGGNGADSITGDAGDDYLNGGEGNDSLFGGAGNDILDDELGNNLLSGGDGNDEVYGGNNADTLTGDSGDDSLDGGEGNDSLDGGVGSDIADGGDGNDTVTGGDGNDELSGGFDNDSLAGGLGNDELYGDEGNDTLTGGGGADSLFGGIGDDFYVLNATSAGGSIIADDSGTDSLTLNGLTLAIGLAAGTAGVTRGGEFNTDLQIDLNKDGVFKAADDLLILDFFAEPNLEQGDGFIEQVGNLSGTDILKSFPLKATPGPDFLPGGSGDDNIDGLGGNDEIEGNQGNDSLFGNAGNDVLNGDELITISEAGGDVILGTGIGNDYLDGAEGNDTLDGGEGNDTLLGGAGDDSLWAGKDNDIINGGDGKDSLYGDEGNDSLFGGAGNDFLFGNEGNDTLDGGDGDDSLNGGLGNDSIVGGAGIDTVSYAILPSPVNINLATGVAIAEGTDTLTGIEVITGTTFADTIVGSSSNETLIGNGGA